MIFFKDKSPTFITGTIIIPLALIGFSFAVMLPYMPPYYPINMDSGIFLYIGREIIRGKLLYMDMWDHKGPLIFFIDALGYWLGGRIGVWFIQSVFLSISVVTGYAVLRRIINPIFAVFGTFCWVYSFFFILVGGNLTEEFSLPLSFLSILFFNRYMKDGKSVHLFLIGVAMGLSAMLRPNNIGVELVVCVIILISNLRKRHDAVFLFWNVCAIILGVIFVLAPISIYFFVNGAFGEFINATFVYNVLYVSGKGFADQLAIPLFLVTLGWPIWFAILGWLVVIKDYFRENRWFPADMALLLIIGFPVEVILDTMSGRPYLHYVILLLPYIGFLDAYFLYKFIPLFKRQSKILKLTMAMVLCSALLFSIWGNILFLNWGAGTPLNESSDIITFIKANTTKSDTVLVWGQETALNVLADRESPTPYVSQTFFLYENGVTPNMRQIFLSGLEKNKPEMVIITRAMPFRDNDPLAFDAQMKFFKPDAVDVFRSFSEYIHKNYRKIKTIQNFQIYSLSK